MPDRLVLIYLPGSSHFDMRLLAGCFLILFVLYYSCGSSKSALDRKENKLFNQWVGHSKNQLVTQWGEPDSTRSDGKNGEVLIYIERTDIQSVMNEEFTGKLYSPRKEMFVNADSVIYAWRAWRRK